jgi:hypothetical protein
MTVPPTITSETARRAGCTAAVTTNHAAAADTAGSSFSTNRKGRRDARIRAEIV